MLHTRFSMFARASHFFAVQHRFSARDTWSAGYFGIRYWIWLVASLMKSKQRAGEISSLNLKFELNKLMVVWQAANSSANQRSIGLVSRRSKGANLLWQTTFWTKPNFSPFVRPSLQNSLSSADTSAPIVNRKHRTISSVKLIPAILHRRASRRTHSKSGNLQW